MADTFITDLITRMRLHLFESTADQWSDAKLTEFIGQAVGDFSRRRPNETYSDTYFLGGTRMIDVSDLSAYDITKVQYEFGDAGEHKVPREFVNFTRTGDYIEIVSSSTPTGDSDVTGTADGDVASHLQDDTNVQFASDMVNAKVVNTTDSLETYATAYNDTGDLTLNEDIFPDGDEDYTIYERVPARVWYTTKHTYSETVRSFSAVFEDLILEGSICYALIAYAIEATTKNNVGGATVAEKMLMLARDRLALYNKELDRVRPLRRTERHG